MEENILAFIKKHHVLTLAVTDNLLPYCCSCYYAFDKTENAFLFSSDLKTKHADCFTKTPQVAGTIHLETEIVGKIRGIQFTGTILTLNEEEQKKATKTYLKRFPFALAMNPSVWVLRIDWIKFTDNRLGFGKKLIWERNATL